MNKFCKDYYILCLFCFVVSSCTSNKNNSYDINNIDPFESTNRQVFNFNNNLDDYFFKPVARGWRKLPSFPKDNLANMAETAYAPLSLANAMLQFDTEGIGLITKRLLINLGDEKKL